MRRLDAFALRELLGPHADLCRRAISGDHGVVLPPFVDHHVHLHLIDERTLLSHGIAAVLDLGGDPVELARRPKNHMPRAAYAGAFLTAVGGYPVGRSWAPDAIVREVSDPSLVPGVAGGAGTAVDEQASFGASVVKVTLNASTGPVPEPALLRAIVAAARSHGLPVVAHVEGEGMTERAVEAGVDVLAHAPFSERLDESLVRRAASSQRWISTLSIHDGDAAADAVDNVARFVSDGGRLLYGTDLGNGAQPVGVNVRELDGLHAAGVRGAALIAALSDPWPFPERSNAVATFVPGHPPTDLDSVPGWLAGATVLPAEELVHDDH
ncbi:hypothetical protein ACLQ2Q_16770 [Microbacterium sp. DT81.1]|uniref:hypothetical protein n=1 Tax=Microbacterium sp. DT81.1 TaxID=3393413 RepID=UPI003CF5C547